MPVCLHGNSAHSQLNKYRNAQILFLDGNSSLPTTQSLKSKVFCSTPIECHTGQTSSCYLQIFWYIYCNWHCTMKNSFLTGKKKSSAVKELKIHQSFRNCSNLQKLLMRMWLGQCWPKQYLFQVDVIHLQNRGWEQSKASSQLYLISDKILSKLSGKLVWMSILCNFPHHLLNWCHKPTSLVFSDKNIENHFRLLDKETSSAAHGQLSNFIGAIIHVIVLYTSLCVVVAVTWQIFCSYHPC